MVGLLSDISRLFRLFVSHVSKLWLFKANRDKSLNLVNMIEEKKIFL